MHEDVDGDHQAKHEEEHDRARVTAKGDRRKNQPQKETAYRHPEPKHLIVPSGDLK